MASNPCCFGWHSFCSQAATESEFRLPCLLVGVEVPNGIFGGSDVLAFLHSRVVVDLKNHEVIVKFGQEPVRLVFVQQSAACVCLRGRGQGYLSHRLLSDWHCSFEMRPYFSSLTCDWDQQLSKRARLSKTIRNSSVQASSELVSRIPR